MLRKWQNWNDGTTHLPYECIIRSDQKQDNARKEENEATVAYIG